jgi:signal transduction histidine kinase
MEKNIYGKKFLWKISLLCIGVIIAISSLLYTNQIVKKLSAEEEKKVALIAESWKQILDENNTSDISFLLQIIKNNTTVPVILADHNNQIVSWRNLDSSKAINNKNYLPNMIAEMKEINDPILVPLADNELQYIFYKNSILVDALQYYPWVQLTVIFLFILIAYYAFSSSRNAEQNQVWVGMSKETAHQLGTPLSSLYGWLEFLKTQSIEESVTLEIEKDLIRLNTITDRFSKIGSVPKLEAQDITTVVEEAIMYMKKRISKNIQLQFNSELDADTQVNLCKPLFEWVLENLLKNAVDSMAGNGNLDIVISKGSKNDIYIDITDTGKGIQKSQFKTIFKPGFTSKKRGWGLGLSLAKRIIENYHFGKIFVKNSEISKGSTFRIILPITAN